MENQDPGTNADLTASLDLAEPDLTELEYTVNASYPPEDQEVVNTHDQNYNRLFHIQDKRVSHPACCDTSGQAAPTPSVKCQSVVKWCLNSNQEY